ncbi:ribosome recycling factor [Brachybacterium sp. NBEC-018]|uniref:Ribosome-recycling factor n=1 Tax=Brachybacterium rhamnosum TaxID=173361 RepID=A0ABW4PSM1_9MICO|nr:MULTISPECIES: ribosome recycling factor [Brachybacterium]MCW1805212.1 ribosome recycling factor [Brachybacterium squillarum]QCR54529.1 ribosome recycling factor [Brachybacterium sp. SGAir0954]UVY83507.1 ribosome recycling factor [Brachybacterium sp. NBEC-018]
MSDDIPGILKDAESKMSKSIEVTKDEFTAIRTGRATAAMFQGIDVEYYGAPTPLNQLASLQFPEARTVIVTPYDKTATTAVETALRESDLGVNPTNNGDNLRVVLPALTEERRRDYIKLAKNKAEDGRVAIRGSRGNAKKAIEKLVKDKEIGEDEGTRAEKELEALTKKHIEQIDEALAAKETELATV